MTDVATSWLQTLAARGVTVTVRNNRLWLHPASAHRQLSDDEVLTLRHHRQAIKDVVREGKTYATTIHEPAPATAPRVEKPTPDPACRWCNRSPCIGDQHQAFYALHPEAAQKREAERVNKEFRLAFGMDPWPR